MRRIIQIISLLILASLLEAEIVFAQGALNQLLNKARSYHNPSYGFKIRYFGELEEQNPKQVVIKLPKFEEDQVPQSYITISVEKQPFVDLPGTYGGRLYLNTDSPSALLQDRYVVEHVVINGLAFIKEYWLVYGGMGNWDTVINCYTKQNGRYYVISLHYPFLSGVPGKVVNGRKISKGELITKGLKAMHDNNNDYVQAFNTVLSSFSINKISK